MKTTNIESGLLAIVLVLSLLVSFDGSAPASAADVMDATYQTLPFNQNWANTGLITGDDDWSGVLGIVGYRGDGLTTVDDVDPQTITVDGLTTPIDVYANQTAPDTFTSGGVAEFEITDPVVALQGSGTADAPFILIHVDTTGYRNISVSYNVRDVDGATDSAVQQVALHYRVGGSGNYTNIPAAYIADATTGPSLAVKVTSINITLPSDTDNQSQVQLRIMTTKATGYDEWVGIDDISILGEPLAVTLTDFSAVWQRDAVRVTWETAQELDNLGFNLYRSESETGPWVKLNDTLIPTQNPGAIFGAVYEWLDVEGTQGPTYFYRLEDVDIYGISTFHGPVSTEPTAPSTVTLTAFGVNGAAWSLPLALAALGLWVAARRRRS
ncbi:MAG: hypothetical protein RBT75_04730 [Anaerolineae bacterium]|jgi:hypothetical protein|nr:hypothetical protein [Anaerolineae bacterium]